MTVTDSLAARAAAQPKRKPFLVTDRDWSYGDVGDIAEHMAGWAHDKNLVAGDVVMVALSDSFVASAVILGLMLAGLVPAIADVGNTAAEIAVMAQITTPRVAIIDGDLVERWGLGTLVPIETVIGVGAAGKTGGLAARLLGPLRPQTDPLDWLRAAPRRSLPSILPESTAYIIFTSGTTGRPRGVCVSHRALLAHLATLQRQFEYDEGAQILNVLPLSHVDGLIQGPLLAYYCGATVHRPMTFSAAAIDDLLSVVYARRISHFIAVPTILSMILRLAGRELDGVFQGGDLRCVVSAAAHLDEQLWRAFEARYGVIVANLYGLTETVTGGLFCGPDAATRRVGTLGRPVDCVIRIIDQHGNDVSQGETGELIIQGPSLMTGYVGAPDETAAVLQNGWLHTGDLVFCDCDGFVHYAGRRKNLIISGGLNVQPEEVADVLKRHPCVVDAAVLGEPHPDLGEVVLAAVVMQEDTDTLALIAHCRSHLSDYKVPRRIIAVPSLPKGRSGKIILSEVRAMLAGPPAAAAQDTDARVIEVAASVFMVPATSLVLDSSPDNTPGWDSLGHLMFASALEKSFGVALSPVEIVSITSLAAAVRLLSAKAGDP